ncbi:MAG: hypothetical protein QXH30_02260 [Candidatus Bilamarchaeaceae archaeon]
MQVVIPNEGRRARLERFRRHFAAGISSSFCFGPRKVPMEEAAARLGIPQSSLESILARRRAKGSRHSAIELRYDFRVFPIWVERGQIQNGVLSEESLQILSRYVKLRSAIAEKAILTVSAAACRNSSVIAMPRRRIELIDDFVLSHLRFSIDSCPFVSLSPIGYGMGVPIREYKCVLYSFPEHAGPIIFAARMLSRSGTAKLVEIEKVRREAAMASSAGEISVSLGMRLWMLREMFANPDYRGLFTPRAFGMMDNILADPIVLEFFAKSYNTYIDPKIRTPCSPVFRQRKKMRTVFC